MDPAADPQQNSSIRDFVLANVVGDVFLYNYTADPPNKKHGQYVALPKQTHPIVVILSCYISNKRRFKTSRTQSYMQNNI